METIQPNIERLALGNILDGFNTQSVGMPAICQRFIELSEELTEEDTKKAIDTYQEIISSKIAGLNLNIAMMVAYYILAELTLQRKDHMNKIIQSADKVAKQGDQGYV